MLQERSGPDTRAFIATKIVDRGCGAVSSSDSCQDLEAAEWKQWAETLLKEKKKQNENELTANVGPAPVLSEPHVKPTYLKRMLVLFGEVEAVSSPGPATQIRGDLSRFPCDVFKREHVHPWLHVCERIPSLCSRI